MDPYKLTMLDNDTFAPQPSQTIIVHEIPLGDERSCFVQIPRDLTHAEALRIGSILEALAVDG